jgi:DNA-binding response OmpR family regulator
MMSTGKTTIAASNDELIRQILRVAPFNAGYELLRAKDGKRAVEIATPEEPDPALSGAMLPKLHGFEVSKEIKQVDKTPAVFLRAGISTKSTGGLRIMRDFGADSAFDKPVGYDELFECTQRRLNLPGLMPVGDPRPVASYAF